jgi:acetyltransferase-like isoleucine patch superfamily enzyme
MRPGVKIDALANVESPELLGTGTKVWAFARVFAGVVTGEGVNVGTGVYIGRNAVLGDATRVGDGAHITDHMVVGARCFIAPHVIFCNDRHPVVGNADGFVRECPVVEDDVSIGVNATILPGVRLGAGCRVGAGAVVVRDVAPGDTVVGNPAHSVRRLTEDAAAMLAALGGVPGDEL